MYVANTKTEGPLGADCPYTTREVKGSPSLKPLPTATSKSFPKENWEVKVKVVDVEESGSTRNTENEIPKGEEGGSRGA